MAKLQIKPFPVSTHTQTHTKLNSEEHGCKWCIKTSLNSDESTGFLDLDSTKLFYVFCLAGRILEKYSSYKNQLAQKQTLSTSQKKKNGKNGFIPNKTFFISSYS